MPDISKRLDKAEKYLQRGKPEAALEEYLSILQDEPRNEQVRQTAADLCLALGRGAEAAGLLSSMFEQEAEIGDIAKGIVTYKKLAKITVPTPLQTFHYAQLVERKDKHEALAAYESALSGFEKQRKNAQVLAAAKRIVELSPTAENYQRAGEKAALMGEGRVAAANFVQLGQVKDEASPGSGFQWYERAYHLDPMNLQAVFLYSRGLFVRNHLPECIDVLTPVVTRFQSTPEIRELYAHAMMAAHRPADAEPHSWELFVRDPQQLEEIAALVGVYLDVGDNPGAIALARKIEDHESRAGRRREFLTAMFEMSDRRQASLQFTEYLEKLFANAGREHEYSRILLKLFQLYSDAGRFREAAETLDRAAELDPYESGHAKRLETLRGRIDEKLYSRVANRFQKEIKQGKARAGQPVPSGAAPSAPEAAAAPAISGEAQAHVLEDLILQAELYMQYGMKAKALEGVERIHKQFPREELKNEKLRHLYASAGFTPHYKADAPAIPAQPPAAAANNRAVSAPDGGTSVDSFARVTDITRNIYRQASVKSVLFTAVNEIGRHFGASRCVAGLCTPGKPPSAALEFCAPGIKQSDVMSIVKLIAVGQQLAANGAVTIPNAQKAPELASAKEHVEALSIQSMVAVPLLDSGEQSGILILEQITPRQWQSTDLELLNTLAEQVVQAVANARLRSLMKTLAVTDEKSGLLKRSSYLDVLLSEVKRSLQQQTPLTLLLLHFGKASVLVKEVGQSQVENMMQQIGQSLASHIRQNDVAVRYDLTTIALLLSDTGEKNAFLVVEKMRKVLAPVKLPGLDRAPTMSAGIGEAFMHEGFDAVDIVTEVINRAETALELARTSTGIKVHAITANLEPTPA
ncbi:MAG TPA: GAF domain-containing protein [Candidatus Acidoferrales bacterium]|jgi:diguanylate cyclase (GGDEF)-like protein|nr:GAF domain-containing protein [Candidatus Acidoferrales bacterium]